LTNLSYLIQGYLSKLEESGLIEAPIYFNQFKTMTAGELLRDMLKFYPSAEAASHKLTDAEELQISQHFNGIFKLLEDYRSQEIQPVIEKDLTKELNLFFANVDQVFSHLFGRDSSKFVFEGNYFNNETVRGLFTDSVVDLLRGERG